MARPLLAALALCLFIGERGGCWGQHIFFWQEPSLVTTVNVKRGSLAFNNKNKGSGTAHFA